MKKLINLIAIFIIYNQVLLAQGVQFSRVYDNIGGTSNYTASFIELPDTGFLLVGQIGYTSIGYSFSMKIDKYGDTVWTKKYVPNGNTIYSIDKINDSLFICAQGFYFPNESSINIGIIDNNGDSLFHLYYDSLGATWPIQIHRCLDGGFIMCEDGGHPDIIKLDSNYNIEWARTSYMSQCANIKPDVDSGFIAVGCSGQTIKKYGVLRIDKNGNDIWYNALGNMPPSPDSYYACNVQVMTDSNYLISSDGTDWQMMKVHRITGDTIWTKNYPVSLYGLYNRDIWHLEKAGNNNYICAFGSGNNGIMLINGNNGDTIWTHRDPPSFIGEIYELKKTSDGGYAYCGEIGNFTVFVKLDSLGNTVYTSVFNPVDNFQPVTFFPNPANTQLYISPGSMAAEKNVTFTLYDLEGRVMLQQQCDVTQPVDVSTVPTGLYIATLKGKEKEVRGKVMIER